MKIFLDIFGPLCSQKIFFSDFDEILRGNSQKYGDYKYQKIFSKFSFFGPFFNSVRKRPL